MRGDSGDERLQAIAEAPGVLHCQYAQAQLDGTQLRLYAANAKRATHVRHAWADNPVITLFDSAGLPAQPFEVPVDSMPTSTEP